MPLIFGVDHLAFSFAQIAAIGGRVPAFRALRHRAFRWYWLSTSAQASARGMQFFVLGWLVLELTDSVTQLGLVIFLYGVPNLALMLLGGVLADRWERRTLLLVSQGFVSAIIFVLAILTTVDVILLWHVYAATFLMGIIQALNMPSRMAIVSDLVDRDDLMNAVALNMAVMNGGRILGPVIAGGLIELMGIGPALFLNGACYVLGAGFLLFVTGVTRPPVESNTSIISDLSVGIRYFLGSPVALTVVGMGFALGFFGMPYIQILPAFAKESLEVGAAEAGFLLTAAGIGSLIGALILASMGNSQRKNWILMGSAIIFGASLFMFAWSSWYWVSWLILLFVGLGSMTYISTTTTVLQLTAPPEMHGRLLSIWTLSAALMFIGALPMGVAADMLGWNIALAGGAGLCLTVFLVLGIWRPTLRRLDI